MSESKEPPRLPDVVDEAGPSPRWLPWLGIGMLCAVVALIAIREVAFKKLGADAAEAGANSAGSGAEAAPDEKPEAAAEPAAKH